LGGESGDAFAAGLGDLGAECGGVGADLLGGEFGSGFAAAVEAVAAWVAVFGAQVEVAGVGSGWGVVEGGAFPVASGLGEEGRGFGLAVLGEADEATAISDRGSRWQRPMAWTMPGWSQSGRSCRTNVARASAWTRVVLLIVDLWASCRRGLARH